MKRRVFLIGSGVLAGGGVLAAVVPSYRMQAVVQVAQSTVVGPVAPPEPAATETVWKKPEPWAEKLIAAAESQIGETVTYDPAYVSLQFPNGDIPRERGVCTDVVVRAYRDAFGFDLQREVNRDMKAHFASYPKIWGLKGPDRNIDHRRVPNLQAFLKRQGAALAVSGNPEDYQPGDIVSQMLPGNLPHIAIVTHRRSQDGARPLLVHNIGAGTRLEDRLFEFEISGHFRFNPEV
jgi:uncharacterized protein YijF (DUF1287 family)